MQHHTPETLKRLSGHYENFKTHNTVAYETTQSLGNYMNFSAVFLLTHEWQNILHYWRDHLECKIELILKAR